MKIIFLCGSVEPGKDGVGDYTRRLAGELIRQGHECGIIAIMDKDVQETIQELQENEDITVPVLRLPFNKGFLLNCKEAKGWVDTFEPDWISLQYVPFSFHTKGLPFGLGNAINKLIRGRKLHIMFHELWVGMNREASSKLLYWGRLQKIMICSLIRNVKPQAIHTQTKLYQWQVRKMGFTAFLLPLFSNIKKIEFNPRIEIKKDIHFVIFGTIHPEVPVEDFINAIVQYINRNNIGVKITFLGRNGLHLRQWIEICTSKNIITNVMGEQPALIVSKSLGMADFGIATTPLLTAEKSGTVVAMIEHGLPVLCVSKPWKVNNFSEDYTPFGIDFFTGDNLSIFLNKEKESFEINTASNVSKQFLIALQKLN